MPMPKRLWIELWMGRWMAFIASCSLGWPRVATYLMRVVALAEMLCIFWVMAIGLPPLIDRRQSPRLLVRKLGFRLSVGRFWMLKNCMPTTEFGPVPVCYTFPPMKFRAL